MTSLLKLSKFWPFRGSGKQNSGKETVVRAETDPIEATVKFEWNIHKFGHMYPNPSTYDMSRNVLFKKLVSPSFTVSTDNMELTPTKWHVQLICDEEPSSSSFHYMEVSLKLEEFGKEEDLNSSKTPGSFIWQNPKDQFAVRCKMYLVNDKEEVMHTETMAKTMSLARSKCGFLGFTTLERIWKEKTSYFPDNILRIRVELTVISETTSVTNNTRLPPQRMDKLGMDLSHLLNSKNLSDVTIRCQSKTFAAHKQILSARCMFFERMFESQMMESKSPHTVDIVDIEPDTCFSLLYYLYTDQVDFPQTDVRKLSALAGVADKYGLDALKDYCFQSLQVQINLTNAGSLAVLAYFYNADSKTVAKNIRQFCHTNWGLLKSNAEFRQLVADYPGAFVRNL